MRQKSPHREKSLGLTPADVPLELLPVVELSDSQFQRAKEIAESRNQTYDQINGGRVCGNQTSYEAHLTGAIGELAYAIEYDDCIDESIYEVGDDGYDFVSGSLKVDTKTTATYIERPSLIVPVDPEPIADIYFLIHRIEERTVRLVGLATYGIVKRREPIRKPGRSLNYVIPQEQLLLPPGLEKKLCKDAFADASQL